MASEPVLVDHKEKLQIIELGKYLDRAQQSLAVHGKIVLDIRKSYADQPQQCFEDLKIFLNKVLSAKKRTLASERALRLFSKLAVHPTSQESERLWAESFTWACVFYCLELMSAKAKSVRFRVCELVGLIMNDMPEDQEIGDMEYQMILSKMGPLLRDKVPSIRGQAVISLSRLQDPADSEDPMSKEMLHMLMHDVSKDVRKECVRNLGICRETLHYLLTRIRDASGQVRRAAFATLKEKLMDIRVLTIYQRNHILKSGLEDRDPLVRRECSSALLEVWFPRVNSDLLQFLKLLNVEDNEKEAEKIATHIIGKNAHVNTPAPPYKEAISVEHVVYWRLLCNSIMVVKKTEEPDYDLLDSYLPDTVEFCSLIEEHVESEFMTTQLLRLALHLDIHDEVSRNKVIDLAQRFLKDLALSNDLMAHVLKLLRNLYSDESEYVTFVLEIVSDLRDPLDAATAALNLEGGEISPEEDAAQRAQLDARFQELEEETKELRGELETCKMAEDFEEAAAVKKKLEAIDQEIRGVDDLINVKDKRDIAIWQRIIAIVSDLLRFTQKGLALPSIEMLLKATIRKAVTNLSPFIRAPALEALSLYCLLDTAAARTHLVLFMHVIHNDQEALQLIAMKAIFDQILVHDVHLFAEDPEPAVPDPPSREASPPPDDADEFKHNSVAEAEAMRREEGVTPCEGQGEEEEVMANGEAIPAALKRVTAEAAYASLTEYLQSDDEHLLFCAVEGFSKLMCMNRLHDVHVLSLLVLLYFSPATMEDERCRQCLAIFFPAFAASSITSSLGHRKALQACLLPTLRTLAYAPVESPLRAVNAANVAQFILSLLQTDPDPNAKQQSDEPAMPMTYHESLAFDICPEVLAAPRADSAVRVLCRVLAMLEFDPESQHNIKSFRELVRHMNREVVDKRALRYLGNIAARLVKMDKSPEEQLGEDKLLELENQTADRIRDAVALQKSAIERNKTPEPPAPQTPEQKKPDHESPKKTKKLAKKHVSALEYASDSEVEGQQPSQAGNGPPLTVRRVAASGTLATASRPEGWMGNTPSLPRHRSKHGKSKKRGRSKKAASPQPLPTPQAVASSVKMKVRAHARSPMGPIPLDVEALNAAADTPRAAPTQGSRLTPRAKPVSPGKKKKKSFSRSPRKILSSPLSSSPPRKRARSSRIAGNKGATETVGSSLTESFDAEDDSKDSDFDGNNMDVQSSPLVVRRKAPDPDLLSSATEESQPRSEAVEPAKAKQTKQNLADIDKLLSDSSDEDDALDPRQTMSKEERTKQNMEDIDAMLSDSSDDNVQPSSKEKQRQKNIVDINKMLSDSSDEDM
eukprot:173343_1